MSKDKLHLTGVYIEWRRLPSLPDHLNDEDFDVELTEEEMEQKIAWDNGEWWEEQCYAVAYLEFRTPLFNNRPIDSPVFRVEATNEHVLESFIDDEEWRRDFEQRALASLFAILNLGYGISDRDFFSIVEPTAVYRDETLADESIKPCHAL